MSSLAYRPDIDGLRAVAVGAVFLFHLDEGLLSGGFVGVDVFFVISGFLITKILHAELSETGKLNLARFYQRRISRLFPVAILVTISTLLAASVIYTPQDFASAGVNSVAAILSLANVKYFLQGSYFEISPDAQPFLHFWSLSVEEQFYLLYPVSLILIIRFFPSHLAAVLLTIAGASFALCVVVTFWEPKAAFYLLPTRAWELAIGGYVAIAGPSLMATLRDRFAVDQYLAVAGLVAIAVSCVAFDPETVFPGYAAALPVLGSAAVLLATGQQQYIGYRLLSAPIAVVVGKVSYTLYLWHWPVFSFVDYALFPSPEWLRYALKIGLSGLLTALTHVMLENPTRRYLNRPDRRRLAYGGFAGIVVLLVPLGLSIRTHNYVNATAAQVAHGGIEFRRDPDAPTVLMLGDSHASMYGKVLREITDELGYNFVMGGVSAGDSLPALDGNDSRLWSSQLQLAKDVEPDFLIFVNLWGNKLGDTPERLDVALTGLKPHADHILLFNQPPLLPPNASRQGIRQGDRPPFFEEPRDRARRIASNSYIASLREPQVTEVDIQSAFLDGEGSVLFTDEEQRLLYHDRKHISGHGADRVRARIVAALETASRPSRRPADGDAASFHEKID